MKKNRFSFFTFPTEEAAIAFKKSQRWRKATIHYSEYWKCWILGRTN